MNKIGYSTGSLALGNFKEGIKLLMEYQIPVIEISTLREQEFVAFLNEIPTLDLSYFDYISLHLPSKLINLTEEEIVDKLLLLNKNTWSFIVHPDVLSKFEKWNLLGNTLCIENMDKRKECGRTVVELDLIFNKLTQATFCLDIAHAKQVDNSMLEAYNMLQKYKQKLVQIHISELNSISKHERLNLESIFSYRKIASYFPPTIPLIIEAPVPSNYIMEEIKMVETLFYSGVKNESTQNLLYSLLK